MMLLAFRPPEPSEYREIEDMVIESFEPFTWLRRTDERMGPLNGRDWRLRWRDRMRDVFETQIILVGDAGGERLAAMACGTLDRHSALAYLNVLAVNPRFRRLGYGREMLQGMMQHLKNLGAQYIYLDSIADNDPANELYRAEGFEQVALQIRWIKKIP